MTTLDNIREAVEKSYGFSPLQKCRKRNSSEAKTLFCYFARENGFTVVATANYLDIHHSTVSFHAHKADGLSRWYGWFRAYMHAVSDILTKRSS